MAKCILFIGQSLANALCNSSSGTQTADSQTYMWNNTGGWVPPVGDGAIAYSRRLREALGEPIYLVNASVDGSCLLNYGAPGSTNCWSAPTGAMITNAIAQTQAALATVSGMSLWRIEVIRGQSEAVAQGFYDMATSYLDAQRLELTTLRAALGNGFRFCVWPVGKVASGSTRNVLRAQMEITTSANAPSLGIEPGPAYYDVVYIDGMHPASPQEYKRMGIRGARNAKSYAEAQAAGTHMTTPHYGAGPVIPFRGVASVAPEIMRDAGGGRSVMFAVPHVKQGHTLTGSQQWPAYDTTWVTGWNALWASSGGPVTITSVQINGGWLKIHTDWMFAFPVWPSYQSERTDDPTAAVYDTNQEWDDGGLGQPMLPLVLATVVSG